jgi:hypothetical protein
MILKFQRSIVETFEEYAKSEWTKSANAANVNDTNQEQDELTGQAIAFLFFIVIVSILLFSCFLYVAYYFPWWFLYEKLCFVCVEPYWCNFLYCFHTCPCFERRARETQLRKRQNNIIIQDLLTTPDGRVIKMSNVRTNF